ncbi:MAG: type IV pilus assembly protein PilM [Candidatus Binatia bacterium]
MAVASEWQDRVKRLFTVSLTDLNPFRRQESYVAIDIGSSSIKMLEVRTATDQLELLNWGSIPTPASAIQSNMVSEPDRVAEAVKALLEAKGVRAKKAVTAVPGPAVMIKRVTLPSQGAQETENTIMFEAGNFIPEELDNVNLDYQVVDQRADAKEMEVLLAAAKKDIVGSYAETLRAAGLLPVVVDVDYFALDNLYELNYDAVDGQVVALVNIGARYSSINILKSGRSVFTGDVPVGGRDITEALTRDLGVPAEEAERLKTGKGGSSFDAEQLNMALGPAVDALIEEIHYALSFFWTAATDERIDMLYLSGGAAQTPELAERLAQRIEAPVEVTDPFSRITLSASIDGAALQRRASEFAVALGLSVRRPGDK